MEWKNKTWNDLGNGRFLYVLEDAPNIFNCNTFLLATPEALLLIDHGGTPERAAAIEAVVGEWEKSHPGKKPVAALITHCHWDHLGGLTCYTPEFRRRLTVVFHAETPECLADPNLDYACAGVFGVTVSPIEPDLLFFDESKTAAGPFTTRMEGVNCQLLCNGVVQLTALPAPGHATDSLFYEFDDCCLVNDTLFGLNPGVVGQPGWNAGHFKRSLKLLLKMAEAHPDRLFGLGHGTSKRAAECVPALQTLLERTDLYRNAPLVTHEKISELKGFSKMLLAESERLFAIIAGRLFRFSFELEARGRADLARELETALDFTEIESQLERFRQTINRMKEADSPVVLALRGIRTVEKIRSLMAEERFHDFMGMPLLRRATTLLNDFASSVAGIPLTWENKQFDLNGKTADFLAGLKPVPGAGDDLPKSIATQLLAAGVFRKTEFVFQTADAPVLVTTSQERFFDAVQHFLEQLAVGGAQRITVQVIRNGLVIQPEPAVAGVEEKLLQGLSGCFLSELGCRIGCSSQTYIILF